jgi:hypothetical protein
VIGALASGPIDLGRLKRSHRWLADEIRGAAVDAMQAAGEEAQRYVASSAVPFTHRSGAIAKGTRYRIVRTSNGAVLKIRNTAPHAGYVERGTKPHRIVARRAKALRFVAGGRVVFARSVWHPGTKATWFLRTATERAGVRFLNEFQGRSSRILATARNR